MTLMELLRRLEGTGLPVAYLAFPEGEAPALPFLCWQTDGVNSLPADGGVYLTWDEVRIELYTALRSPETEALVEEALTGLYWHKDIAYISTQRCWMTTYEIEV